jgi:hypothetical protein
VNNTLDYLGTRRLAVMQPYLFPYVGYFQLALAADHFVFLDDVTYIKQGWINRNRLVQGSQSTWFTVPLSGAGSHVLIRDAVIDERGYARWRKKFFSAVDQYYRNAPGFAAARPLMEHVFPAMIEPGASIASMAKRSVSSTMAFLSLPLNAVESSLVGSAHGARGVDRVLDICETYEARTYINLPGGRALYDEAIFRLRGLNLAFVAPGPKALALGIAPDGCQLSLLHVLMRNDADIVRDALHDYTLEEESRGTSG